MSDLEHYYKPVTVRLEALATGLYGPDWAAGISRLSGVSLRTCQRVRRSIANGVEDRRARGVLDASLTAINDLTYPLLDDIVLEGMANVDFTDSRQVLDWLFRPGSPATMLAEWPALALATQADGAKEDD
jgi:hypothetical protein